MVVNLKGKHYFILLSAVLVSILTIVFFYYSTYSTKQLELNRVKQETTMENQLIQLLETQQNTESIVDGSSTDLQRKIPVVPYVEQFILHLEEVAKQTQASLVNISFTDTVPTDTTLDEEIDLITEDEKEENVGAETNLIALPNGLKMISVNLSVEVNNYSSLRRFIEILENSARITQIDSVTFSGNVDDLMFSIVASAYYHPELTDLIEELPPLSIPNPSNKTNPFSNN